MYETLLKEFIQKFPIPKGHSKNPYILLFDAYTGMGKSTVALEIAKYEDVVIINNDEIRSFLCDYKDETGLKDQLQRYRLEELLKNNNNCICDSCFCHNYESKLKYYQSLGYRYYVIRLECSDETVRKRLSSRTVNGINYSVADYNDYVWMKHNVERVPLGLVDFTINTEQELKPQVEALITFLKSSCKKDNN